MSSRARPCYQNLSQYTQNGLVPIRAPTPADTKPQIFTVFTPHKFSQKDYHLHLRAQNKQKHNFNNTGYVNYSSTDCANNNSLAEYYTTQSSSHYVNSVNGNNKNSYENFGKGFNEVIY